MDYCHPCRRHLNGALACPGCGTAAEALRASSPEQTYAQEYAYTAQQGGYVQEPYGQETYGQEAHGQDAAASGTPRVPAQAGPDPSENYGGVQGSADPDLDDSDGSDGLDDGDSGDNGDDTPGAQMTRRDRKAAVHRRRRRRALLVTAGFVLAAGGLSLAELGMDAPGSSSRNPSAAGGESSEIDGDAATPGESAEPLNTSQGSGSNGTSASADPSASASASPSDSASPSPSASESPSDAPTGGGTRFSAPGTTPTDPNATEGPAPDPSPTTEDPTPSDPAPEPSPSETCNRFLWWCT
ncbi:hypothetical protein [Streptomyces sp. NPDC018693]|uniref:SCO2400 family protein n=1 Tax=unclassified Streptomyces TaxID=2593676 RepID=UPI003792207D